MGPSIQNTMMLEMIAFCGYEHPSADEIMSANEETKFLNSLPPTEREDIRCYKNADFAMATNCKGDLELHMNVDGLESGFLAGSNGRHWASSASNLSVKRSVSSPTFQKENMTYNPITCVFDKFYTFCINHRHNVRLSFPSDYSITDIVGNGKIIN
ncbi:hypothetical protein NC653_025467 [Populus alba x Populus x berolinensis]|uniref:Uncharacterized protein n=1 Tax=Populus alba x Populus x berolinensis TaxID=444605 RepID=A0AAD6MC60_9ROSI|nr:hypothetical protein NC653_025467 [Populus alba x Populus x berolinensis]